jgi:hypothetical protein
MARSINSPGVQITETDISTIVEQPAGTSVFVTGFAPQGPTDEVINITSLSEFEQIYGTPSTPAERYFYYSAKELLNSPATLLTSRMPYGSGLGAGFDNKQYSALLYPVSLSSVNTFALQKPVHKNLSEQEYYKLIQGDFTWSAIVTGNATPDFDGTTLTAGVVILNKLQTTVNEKFEGYYVALTDNSKIGPLTDFTSVNKVLSLTGTDTPLVGIPTSRFSFALSGSFIQAGQNSVSETIESIPTFNFGDAFYNDSLIVTVFKIRTSVYEPQVLAINLLESHIGSFDINKRTVGGSSNIQQSSYIEDVINKNSSTLQILINPNVSEKVDWSNPETTVPNYTVRQNDSSLVTFSSYLATYQNEKKVIGNVTSKLERVLALLESAETASVDLVVDAGLSTIGAIAEEEYLDSKFVTLSELSDTNSTIVNRWRQITNTFVNFAQNTRKDCMVISDPIRQIFVNGIDTKNITLKGNTFSEHIYKPLKNIYSTVNTSFAAAYGNWAKSYDSFIDRPIWLPVSGNIAAIYARTDLNAQPWVAPAGLTRGLLNNITDIAFNPNQKQRDFLYTISINPIVFFNADGFVVFGQKTLQTKPSAFDRVNVRRLFLVLEKAVLKTLRYYVFEPNTEETRTRLVNSIEPIFENAKNTEGLYDYLVVCDERNNTDANIDNNELKVDIYLKPARAAEFILVNFVATRSGQSFEELI